VRKPVIKRDPAYVQRLLEEMYNGDSNAFAAIYSVTCRDLYRHAYGRLCDIYRTQDAVTETYIRAVHGKKPSDVPLARWLDGISDSVCDRILKCSGKNAIDSGTPGGGKGSGSGGCGDMPDFDRDTEEQMLYNILDIAGMEQNTVPLRDLGIYMDYRRHKSRTMTAVVLALAVLIFAAPLFLIRPEMTMKKTESRDESGRPVYTLRVSSVPEVYSVRAQIDQVQMPVYQEGASLYTVRPTREGTMTVTVTAWNRRTASETVVVGRNDAQMP
jgi:hypothetical protein